MRIEILADINPRPSNPFQGLHKTLPGVGPSLAFAVEPLEQNPGRVGSRDDAQVFVVASDSWKSGDPGGA